MAQLVIGPLAGVHCMINYTHSPRCRSFCIKLYLWITQQRLENKHHSFCIKLYKSRDKDRKKAFGTYSYLLFCYIPPYPFSFPCMEAFLVCFETKVRSNDILLLLRTDMSEWSVWVTMPEVQRASKYTTDSLVSVSASVFVPAIALYFCLRVVCIFVHAPGLFPLLPNCSLLSPICTLYLLLSNHISSPFGISLAFHAGLFPFILPNSNLVGSKRNFPYYFYYND